jgi:hypothetical protein
MKKVEIMAREKKMCAAVQRWMINMLGPSAADDAWLENGAVKEDSEVGLLGLGRKSERLIFVKKATIAKDRFARVPARMVSEVMAD